MADNVTLNNGTGGAVMATDDIAGVHHQLVKVEFGASDSATPVSPSNPLPVLTAPRGATTATIGALVAAATTPTDGCTSVGFNITTGLTGTIKAQARYDATWQDVPFQVVTAGGAYSVASSFVLAAAALRGSIEVAPGVIEVRIVCSAYTSGSATCTIAPTNSQPGVRLISADYTGAAAVVKVASPATTDPALVASIHPNSAGMIADNGVFTPDTTRVLMAGFVVDETAGTAPAENDALAARVDTKRAIVNVIEDAATRGRRCTVTTRGSFYVEGPDATDAAVAGNPLLMGGRVNSGTPTAMTANNDVAPLWLTLNGALNVADAGGSITVDDGGGSLTVDGAVSVDDGGGSLTVDGTVTVTQTTASNLLTQPVPANSSTSAVTSVSAATSSTNILSSNASRKGATIFNDSTALMYLLLNSGTASTTNFTVLVPAKGYYELPPMKAGAVYDGAIKAIWSAASGSARITEFT